MSGGRTGRRRAAIALAALLAAACMPEAPTTQGRAVNSLYMVFLGGGAIVGGLVWVLTTWALLRYRRSGPDLPRQTEGNTRLEVIWTALPFVTVGVLFVLTVLTLNVVDARTNDGGVDVRVTGTRWQWRFDYPASAVTVIGTPGQPPPELVLPIGQTVHLTVVATDVAHSFYVPAFLFKRDAIPGITNRFDLDIREPGTWTGQCAEFCGTYHDQMLFTVRAVTGPEFQAWLTARHASASAPDESGPSSQPSAPGSAEP